MNKGLRLVHCKECKRKRFCSNIRIPNHNFRWTCSKGHSWIEVGLTLNRINLLVQDLVMPQVKDLFDRSNTFYKVLKKTR